MTASRRLNMRRQLARLKVVTAKGGHRRRDGMRRAAARAFRVFWWSQPARRPRQVPFFAAVSQTARH